MGGGGWVVVVVLVVVVLVVLVVLRDWLWPRFSFVFGPKVKSINIQNPV